MADRDRPPRWERRRERRARQRRGDHGHYGVVGLAVGLLVRHRRMVRALLIYAGSLLGLLFLYASLDDTPLLDPLLSFNAQATGLLASAFGSSVQVSGSLILADTIAFRIVEECTSLAPFAIFVAAIIAFPATLPRKLVGILLGFVALSAVNLVRITSLVYIGTTFPEALDVAHLLVWQSIMVIVSVMLWLVWMRRYGYHSSI